MELQRRIRTAEAAPHSKLFYESLHEEGARDLYFMVLAGPWPLSHSWRKKIYARNYRVTLVTTSEQARSMPNIVKQYRGEQKFLTA